MATKKLNSAAERLVFRPLSIIDRVDVASLFPSIQPIEVELGSGDGSFVVQYAQARPDRNFIAIERLLGRFRKIAKKGARAGLTNLRAIRIEASYFIEYMLPRRSVSALHVYFPDPWPKRKHRRRRLISEPFTRAAESLLTADGVVYLRTDDADYFAQMHEVFAANPAFVSIATPELPGAVATDFEREFAAAGVKVHRAAWQLRSADLQSASFHSWTR